MKNYEEIANRALEQMKKSGYEITECIRRRVCRYRYGPGTVIREEKDRTVFTTETTIKGVFDTLVVYPNGESELRFDFDPPPSANKKPR